MEMKQTYEHDGNEELCMNGEDYCFIFCVPQGICYFEGYGDNSDIWGERTVFMFDDYSGDSFSLSFLFLLRYRFSSFPIFLLGFSSMYFLLYFRSNLCKR